MRVQIVDPPAYTPPYDHSLSAALAGVGLDLELVTSRFRYGPVPSPDGYVERDLFYRRSASRGPGAGWRLAQRGLEHVVDMRRYGRLARTADIVHYQWLGLPPLDWMWLPRARPRLITAHGTLRGGVPSWSARKVFRRMDAVVALSEYGAAVLRDQGGVPAERVRVIPHGPLDYLTRIPDPAPLPAELDQVDAPVVLFFGLIRRYKGVDLLLDAFSRLDGDAELWVVGRPHEELYLGALRARAERISAPVRFVSRFIQDREVPRMFERADVVVLPYREAEQSGVLHTALAFGKPIVMSSVGGFPEVAAQGAGRLVPPGSPEALAEALHEVLSSPAERERLAAGARAAVAGPYSWRSIAEQHLALYRELLAG
jgi:glycosyltransferase involved in cell wall biosynthesis